MQTGQISKNINSVIHNNLINTFWNQDKLNNFCEGASPMNDFKMRD